MSELWRERVRLMLALAPALAVVVFLFLGGWGLGLAQSLGYLSLLGQTRLTLAAYADLFGCSDFIASLGLTLWIALASTVLSSVLALAGALFLRRLVWGRRWGTFAFQLNLPIPHVVGAIAMLLLLGQSGFLARLGHLVGLIATPADFPALIYDPLALGVILEYSWKATTFIGISVLASLLAIGEDYEATARTLGAGARHKDSVMRTLSHLLVTAGLGDRLQKRGAPVPLKAFLAGSVLPDLALALLTAGYVIANAGIRLRGADGLMDSYHALYFNNPLWIVSHNLFHAPFVIAVLFLAGVLAERRGLRWGPALRWLALGLALHSAVDILTHHDDGPLLLFPFDWRYRFPSPVSYWDRAYYGGMFTVFEYGLDLLLVAYFVLKGAHIWLARRR